jgi:hypothetical protein
MMTDVGRAPAMSSLIGFGPEICGDLGQGPRREWLVTNGVGDYGTGTIAGCQTYASSNTHRSSARSTE